MNLRTFIADSAGEAISQVRDQLGPEAVVLNVRKVPGDGLSRLWRKPRIELVACVPEPPQENRGADLDELRQELAAIKEHITARQAATIPEPALPAAAPTQSAGPSFVETLEPSPLPAERYDSRSGQGALDRWFERSGLLPAYAARLVDEVRSRSASSSSSSASAPAWARTEGGGPSWAGFADEWGVARALLAQWWRSGNAISSNTHVFIGPAGSGKTTALCKWMAQAVLMYNRRCRVWRVDGATANTAESLSIFAEILGAPLERILPVGGVADPSEMVFVDLPGVNWRDKSEVAALGEKLKTVPGAQLHLVLNAAYEGHLLLAQARAFGSLPVADVVLTHFDEEPRWGKIWNLVLGTNYSVSYVSAGQNIPGVFELAAPDKLLPRDLA